MSDKVFFDTNTVFSESDLNRFLGGRALLERFQVVSDIMLPEIVIEEVVYHKLQTLKAKRDAFRSNPFFKLFELSADKIEDSNLDKILQKMREEEQLQFSVVPLRNQNILKELKELAVNHYAPFELGSDKGLKDAIIYYTILQFSQDNPKDKVFLITNDKRLIEAFEKNVDINIFSDFDEYSRHQLHYFRQEYFLESLRTDVDDFQLNSDSLTHGELGEDYIWRLEFHTAKGKYMLEVDYLSREIISIKNSESRD